MRRSTAVRAAALTVLAAGVAAPLVRRRLRLRPPVVMAAAAAAPVALCVLVPRSRARDFGTCLLQMLAYIAAYKMRGFEGSDVPIASVSSASDS